MEQTKSEKDYIQKYQNLGYTSNYQVIDSLLVDVESKKEYAPTEVFIEEEFRFEGISNPGDMSILYVITTKDDNKGTVLANYSPANVTATSEFFREIPNKNNHSKQPSL